MINLKKGTSMESVFASALEAVKSDEAIVVIIVVFGLVLIVRYFMKRKSGNVENQVKGNKRSEIEVSNNSDGTSKNTIEENENSKINISN